MRLFKLYGVWQVDIQTPYLERDRARNILW